MRKFDQRLPAKSKKNGAISVQAKKRTSNIIISVFSSHLLQSANQSKPKLRLFDPRKRPHHHQHRRHDNRPQLNAQALDSGRDYRRAHRDQCEQENSIPARSMVFVDRLRVVDAPEHRFRQVELREADEGLGDDDTVGDDAEVGVHGLPVVGGVETLVVFDDDEAGDEGEDAGQVQGEVDVGSLDLLVGGVGGLKDEDGLREEEDAGGVDEL